MGNQGGSSSFAANMLSFFQGLIPKPNLGQVWEGPQASKAYQDGAINSQQGGPNIRLAFRNLSTVPLLLCWVSENGDLNHFYKLEPTIDPLGYSEISITEADHIEHTRGGHAFCLAHVPKKQLTEAQRLKSLQDTNSIIGGYRPFVNCNGNEVHLVTISKGHYVEDDCCDFLPKKPGLRKRKVHAFVATDESDTTQDTSDMEWMVSACLAEIDPTPYDTTRKVYVLQMIGGWPVYAEPNWHGGDTELEARLANDLQAACKILPRHAVEYLQKNCPIWVNSSIKYGPKVCPVRGIGCCYHPDKDWLIENGMSELKHKCVEVNDAPGYCKDYHLWGCGGLMVHELSHAYHHRMLPQGYKNKEILACYEAAMKDGLYESVKVHGPQGPKAKAYACSNDKEYFAELSTTFLGGTDDSKEFNKWYPFNRKQLREHDPRAYRLLCRLWKVNPKT
eukprot:Nitzschia sp. Nitz4//scaffold51_size120721//60062//61405//NITZ4_003730-RA/size120721-processed-gene-0.154-mRNA-1//-1//CDS//3329553871//8710//frame0